MTRRYNTHPDASTHIKEISSLFGQTQEKLKSCKDVFDRNVMDKEQFNKTIAYLKRQNKERETQVRELSETRRRCL